MFSLDNAHVYRAAELASIPWLEHGFGTRQSVDWPPAGDLASLRQIHSDRVLPAEGPGCGGEGDALITTRPGLGLSVRTADCLPVLLADPRTRAIAAVHAGWRGVAAEIVPKTVRAMAERFGSRPEDLVVAIGPGIGGCCFEVGPEVAIQFAPFFPERTDLEQRTKVDLVETIRRQLRRNGGTVGRIATSDLCTVSGPAGLLHSYRRDREHAGRMVSWIRIRP